MGPIPAPRLRLDSSHGHEWREWRSMRTLSVIEFGWEAASGCSEKRCLSRRLELGDSKITSTGGVILTHRPAR